MIRMSQIHKCNQMSNGVLAETTVYAMSDHTTKTVWKLYGVAQRSIDILYCPYCGKDLSDPTDKGKWVAPIK
jgi:hypothetical protein